MNSHRTVITILTCMVLSGLFWTLCAQDGLCADEPFTFGLVTDADDSVEEPQLLAERANELETLLQHPVRLRMFNSEDSLKQWLIRFREVDFAWFTEAFLQSLPAGEVQRVMTVDIAGGVAKGEVLVAHPGVDPSSLEKVRTALRSLQGPVTPVAGATDAPFAHELAAPIEDVVSAVPADDSEVISAAQSTKEPLPVTPSARPNTVDETSPGVEAVPLAEFPAPVEGADEDSLPVALQADRLSYNQDEESFTASGDVRMSRGATTLTSDELLWQGLTQDAVADGSVTLTDAEGDMTGASLHYNLATQQGRLSDGQVFLRKGHFHLRGDEIDQVGHASYRVADGTFTTCDGENPDWSFSASQVDVTLGNYATARHAWLRIKDVPVLYAPYLIFPVKSERSSGLLSPRIGQSRERGTLISLGWYQVIDRHMDATLYLDFMSKLGLGKGLEYRYLLGRDNLGEVNYYHVSANEDFPEMYAFDWQHGGHLPGDIWLSADVQYVNDRQFFETFGKVAEVYNKDKTVSEIWLQRNWNKLNTVLRGRYIKDLEDSNARTLQRLPELGVSLAPYRLGETPLFARLESYATNFSRDEGEEGQRLFLRPALSATYKVGTMLEFVPEVALYQRVYDTDLRQENQTLVEASATFGTRLQRVYAPGNRFASKIMHSIEPVVSYQYVTDKSEEKLPLFDLKDRLTPRNLIEYALVNRLTLRSDPDTGPPIYREFMNFRLSQSYDIHEARQEDSGDKTPFSDLRAELDLRPTTRSSLRVDGRFNVHDALRVTRLRAGAAVNDASGNGVSIDYVYRDDELETLSTEYLKATISTSLLAPLYLRLEDRYSIKDNQELEKIALLEYRSQCWSIYLRYRDRLDDEEIMVSFEFAGLGRVGEFGGSIGSRN